MRQTPCFIFLEAGKNKTLANKIDLYLIVFDYLLNTVMHVHIKYVDEKQDIELMCTMYAQVQNTSLGINVV